MKKTLIALTAAVGLLLGACSGDDSGPSVAVDKSTTTTQAQTTTTKAKSPSDIAKGYFEAFAANTQTKLDTMIKMAEPNSPAALYATHQANYNRLNPAPGPQDISLKGDVYTLCAGSGADRNCADYSAFVAGPTGKLKTFKVNGNQLEQRIAAGGAPVSNGASQVKISTAYINVGGDLAIIYEIKNGASTVLNTSGATYITADGHQLEAESTGQLAKGVQPGATAMDLAYVPSATRGGKLIVSGYTNDFADEVSFEVPVP